MRCIHKEDKLVPVFGWLEIMDIVFLYGYSDQIIGGAGLSREKTGFVFFPMAADKYPPGIRLNPYFIQSTGSCLT